jgi:hypothetical protein
MLRLSSLPAALIFVLGATAVVLAADDPLMQQAQGLFQPLAADLRFSRSTR